VLANMLVGGSYETVQVYLYHMLGTDGHLSSATIVTFFALIFILFALVLKIGSRKPQSKLPLDGGRRNRFELRADSKTVQKL
jgi:putative spermidine/putrescine transport system permease protein